ncbi:hypothetical protein [Comamonas sp. MYb396]|uniref:hypothetical protein n=1 Tax=Comamonas sp. MYb396 TaxID=2745302 RepID=UPI0030AE979E
MAFLPLPTTSGLQIELQATMLAEESPIKRHWLLLQIDLGASGGVDLYMYQTGIAKWVVKSNSATIIAQAEFRYKTGLVSTNDSFVIRVEWLDAGLFVNVDGLPYAVGVGSSFPVDFVGAIFNLEVALFGGSGQEVLGIDYVDITSPGEAAPEAFWTDLQKTLEVV